MGEQILKEQSELKEMVLTYQNMTVKELRTILQQTKNQEEAEFIQVKQFYLYPIYLFHTD